MKGGSCWVWVVVCSSVLLLVLGAHGFDVSKYNVVWNDTDGIRSSMPLGNGVVGGNFWVDQDLGCLSFYLASQQAWDENTNLLKLALVNITVQPNPFHSSSSNQTFFQTHDLSTSSVNITMGDVSVHIWIDANSPFLSVTLQSTTKEFKIAVLLQNLRPAPIPFPGDFYPWYCSNRFTWADTVVSSSPFPPPNTLFSPNSLLWYHRNNPPGNTSFWESSLRVQQLPELLGKIKDRSLNVTFGGVVFGDPSFGSSKYLTRVNSTALVSSQAFTSFSVLVSIHTNQTTTLQEWYTQLYSQLSAFNSQRNWASHLVKWRDNWNVSHIDLLSPTTSYISYKYVLHRYLQLVQCGARFPLKFNGMMFMAEEGLFPDNRFWGGANWWQNLRLSYWSNFVAGDLNLVHDSLFMYYLDMLEVGRLKTELYWGENTNKSDLVDVYWPETQTIYGLEYNSVLGYGCPGQRNAYQKGVSQGFANRYNINGGLDLSMMILDHYDYTQNITVLHTVFPIVRGVLSHFKHHWPRVNTTTGKVILYPSQALETWACRTYPPVERDCVTNPTPDLAGLHVILSRIQTLPDSVVPQQEKQEWSKYLTMVPDIPLMNSISGPIIAPGELLPYRTTNSENVELYTVHPYRVFTKVKAELNLAINTFKRRRYPCNVGWCQDILDASLLGLVSEAKQMVEERAQVAPAKGYRWPGFMPSFQDYKPSSDHLSNMNSALQWMLLQPLDDERQRMIVLPGWPCEWDVDFKLHGPKNTKVSGVLKAGVLYNLVVEPEERREDVILGSCATADSILQ